MFTQIWLITCDKCGMVYKVYTDYDKGEEEYAETKEGAIRWH